MVASSSNPEPTTTTQPTALDTNLKRLPMILDKIDALSQFAGDQFSRDPNVIHWGHVGDLGRVFIAIFDGVAGNRHIAD